jgi:hypothetical protein
MLIGEALNRRADLQVRITKLRERTAACVLARDGEDPPEDPEELIGELGSLCDELQALIARINHTNAVTRITTDETVTEALARRDVLGLRSSGLRAAVSATVERGYSPYRSTDVRLVRQIRVKEVQAEIDGLARERRELDTLLQRHNWTAQLVG